jgi:Fe-S cluster assembly ATP-binding protein
VHVFVAGRIVQEGGPELAEELETSGYERFAASAIGSATGSATGSPTGSPTGSTVAS